MKHTDVRELFAHSENYKDKSVTVCGWVRTARDSKSISFIELNDGTCLRNVQLIIDKENPKKSFPAVAVGTSLNVTGKFVPSERNGFEILVSDMEVLGECPADYPLQKKLPYPRISENHSPASSQNAVFRSGFCCQKRAFFRNS